MKVKGVSFAFFWQLRHHSLVQCTVAEQKSSNDLKRKLLVTCGYEEPQNYSIINGDLSVSEAV